MIRYLQVEISIVLLWPKQVRVVRDEDTGTTTMVSFTVVVSRVAAGDIDGDMCLI